MNLPKKIKRYKSIDSLLCALYDCKKSKVKEYAVGVGSTSAEETYIDYDEFKKGIEFQGIWGFTKENAIHVWYKQDISEKMLILFLAHEVGHLNGQHYKSIQKEENKAELFGEVAAFSYDKAKQLLKKR